VAAQRIDTGRLGLAVSDSGGGGAPLVFVHGLGGSKQGWRDQLDAAREAGYRAIAYDQRGAGESDKPPGPYSVEDWAQDLIDLLDALELDRVALVGHSVGCMVVEHAALALRERCGALAMLGGVLEWPEEAKPAFEQRAELARAGRMEEIAEAVTGTGLTEAARAQRPELVERMKTMIAANEGHAYAEAALATGRASMREPELIACPALAFAGELDPVTPPVGSRAIAAAMPAGESGVVAGGAHWCMLELPERVDELLLAFLGRAGYRGRAD
jgi:3-oxoadipate enol-lactonase